MKNFIVILIILFTYSTIYALENNDPIKIKFENFILLTNSIYKDGFDKPNRSIYKDIVHSFYDFIETCPDNQWSIAAFMHMAPIINGFHFDKDTSYEEILSFSKSLSFKSEYSKLIFTQVIFKSVAGNSLTENNCDLIKLYKECNDYNYKPYINYLIREYTDNLEKDYKNQLMNEILHNEFYKETLFYPESLRYKAAYYFTINQPQEALNILLEMTSEAFYKNKKWQEAYFVKNGIFESAFLAIIGAYAELKNIDKARAYLQIAEKKFKHNYDLKYYIEEVSLLESKKAR